LRCLKAEAGPEDRGLGVVEPLVPYFLEENQFSSLPTSIC